MCIRDRDTTVQYFKGEEVPFDFQSQLWKNMTFLHDYHMMYTYYRNETNKQIMVNQMFRRMLQYFSGHQNGTERRRFVVWSGHDLTIMGVLASFNLFTHKCIENRFFNRSNETCLTFPGYASNIVWELHKEGERLFVKTLYNGKPIDVCGGKSDTDGTCDYAEFAKVLESKLFKGDWKTYCTHRTQAQIKKDKSYFAWVIILLMLDFCLCGGLVCLYKFWKSKNDKKVEGDLATPLSVGVPAPPAQVMKDQKKQQFQSFCWLRDQLRLSFELR
eukprot:TRINITY_DN4309_c0_g6_i1.p1 TRINITY_DN4309_c0_g6~~TRINITY_DN4309_c0_g6_i1.p1  ORF type:complete len:273 (-),score=33.70 TRINITY_DN4309_c0_g6_i1:252-1070(-)